VIYDGGTLADEEVGQIVLGDGELAGIRFVVPDEVGALVTPLLARRIAAFVEAAEAGTVAALENGSPTG
jgi:hypothetical protein